MDDLKSDLVPASDSGHQIASANENAFSNQQRDQSKRCTNCGEGKPLTDFYSKGERVDSACKMCQKAKKRANRSGATIGKVSKSNPHVLPANIPAFQTKYPDIEPERDSKVVKKSVCFLHWESRYGRSLTDLEKMEIKDNLTNLFKLLESEEVKKCQA